MPAPTDTVAAALARLYDVDLVDVPGDVALYHALANRTDGPILDLAVGSGRVAVPLAAAGWDVTGVDRDPAMLARARARVVAASSAAAGRHELVEADLVGLRLPAGPAFRLGIVALNSIMVLADRTARAAAFATLAAHLAPGGLAVVDVLQPAVADLARYDGRLILAYVRRDPETGLTVTKTGAAEYDASARTIHLTSIFDEGRPGEPPRRWTRVDALRVVGADELVDLAEQAGFTVESLAGDLELGPLTPDSERAVLVARRT
jgi:SAM-dependent methyltransferase